MVNVDVYAPMIKVRDMLRRGAESEILLMDLLQFLQGEHDLAIKADCPASADLYRDWCKRVSEHING